MCGGISAWAGKSIKGKNGAGGWSFRDLSYRGAVAGEGRGDCLL